MPKESLISSLPTINPVEPIPEIPVNAAAQKSVANAIEIAEKKLFELKQIYTLQQTLVLSVYLIINPNESNDELWTGQLTIFVCHQWFLGTSSLTHIQDFESLTLDLQYDTVLKTRREIQLIWVVDGGLDENPRYLKNIKLYCLLFRKFNLDYLTIRTNALGQSKYNPDKVINPELALKNFKYAREALCDIWYRDLIFGKHINAQYVEEFTNSFCNKYFPTLTFLIYHKRLMHPANCERPKEKSKNQTEQTEQNSLTLDNFSLLLLQQYDQILSSDEVYLREWTLDNEQLKTRINS
ncbi:37803_t:CDS:2 [Gigaspora margarita]|uniref:37803_t:CDS:1 n=1 Tax=Gigaspora margarita TaxID=4874 RepID=A0ABN7VD64_GIGMA|nr:37803_t:CDS:2 [Gigaspora margarita]